MRIAPSLTKTKCLLACPSGALEWLSERFPAHDATVTSVAFSPDGTKIVSGSCDKAIKVWELRGPGAERTIVATKEDRTAIDEAYENGFTPISINTLAVTSWEEFDNTVDEEDGEVTIKVWKSSSTQRAKHAPSLAKTDAC